MNATEYMITDLTQKEFDELPAENYAAKERELTELIRKQHRGYLAIWAYGILMGAFVVFAAFSLDPTIFTVGMFLLGAGVFYGVVRVGGTYYRKLLLGLIRDAQASA